MPAVGNKNKSDSNKLARELRNLECTVSDGTEKVGRGRGLGKSVVC